MSHSTDEDYLTILILTDCDRIRSYRFLPAQQYSIRINDQYRICFRWECGYAHEVEITDYH